jgi:hypothetical protein
MAAVLMAVWLCKVHLVGSIGLLAMFLIAVCTSAFYGVLLWTIYVALEPYVRKHWPQVLVSWTNLLDGRVGGSLLGLGETGAETFPKPFSSWVWPSALTP